MKRIIKILGVLVILFNIMIMFPKVVPDCFAYNFNSQIDDIAADKWNPADDGGVEDATKNITGTAIVVIRSVGTGMAIIMITYVAIKYMSAAPDEKAEFKKSATAFIVGAIVLFAASNILAIIAEFATKNIS